MPLILKFLAVTMSGNFGVIFKILKPKLQLYPLVYSILVHRAFHVTERF